MKVQVVTGSKIAGRHGKGSIWSALIYLGIEPRVLCVLDLQGLISTTKLLSSLWSLYFANFPIGQKGMVGF